MSTTLETVLEYSNSKIQGNGNIPDALGIIIANDGLLEFHLDLIKRGVEASQIQECYRDASVPTGGLPSTFLYPSDMLALKILSVNYTDTTPQNYVEATQIDIGNTSANTAFEWFRVNQDVQNPLFDDRGDWFELFPTFTSGMNISQAIRMFYYLVPTAFVYTTDLLSYPDSIDPYILGDKIIALYYESLKDFESAEYYEGKYERRVQKLVDILSKGEDQPIQTAGLPLTGYEF